jgi:hypothetical protein
LRERSKFLPEPHNEPVLFIGSSTEGQTIANDIYQRFARKPVVPKPWSDGVFQASSTSIESLVTAAKEADFAALDESNRLWLEETYGVKFATIHELAQQIK